MRNMAVLHSPAFSYPLPVLVRVLFNLLIFKGKILYYNKYYEIIGETKFPGNTYAHHLCFVGKKGLYISENNENNPQFDENKLVFRCFTLQGRKK